MLVFFTLVTIVHSIKSLCWSWSPLTLRSIFMAIDKASSSKVLIVHSKNFKFKLHSSCSYFISSNWADVLGHSKCDQFTSIDALGHVYTLYFCPEGMQSSYTVFTGTVSRKSWWVKGMWGISLGPNRPFFKFFWSPFNTCGFSKFTILLNINSNHIVWYCSSTDSNLLMLISWHWTCSKGLPKQQPIGVSDSNQSSYDGHPGFQVSDNEGLEFTVLITGFQIVIRRGARSFQMRYGFMKRS
jgi:hypothetical protein